MNDVTAQLRMDANTIADLRRSMQTDVRALTSAQGLLGSVDGSATIVSLAGDAPVLGQLDDAASRVPFLFGQLQAVERAAPDAAPHWNSAISSLSSLAEVLQDRRGTLTDAAGLVDGALSSLGAVDAAFGARLQAIASLVR